MASAPSRAGNCGEAMNSITERAICATGRTSFMGSKPTLSTWGTSVRMLVTVTSSVLPSAGWDSMCLTAMAPPAPGRFSTMTGWRISCAS